MEKQKKSSRKLGVSKRNTYLCNVLRKDRGGYQSGQMGQTVNLLAFAFGGSNPSLPTHLKEDCKTIIAVLFFVYQTS